MAGVFIDELEATKPEPVPVPLWWVVGVFNDFACISTLGRGCRVPVAALCDVHDGAHYGIDPNEPCRLVFDEHGNLKGRLVDNTTTPHCILFSQTEIDALMKQHMPEATKPAEATPTPPHGIKHDEGKPTITLLPWREFAAVHRAYNEAKVLDDVEWSMSYQITRAMQLDDADQWALLGAAIVERDDRNLLAHAYDVEAVLQHGAAKYAPDNWKLVLKEPGGVERYKQACIRHIKAMYDGELTDPDSGLPHAAHALCCVLFILYAKAEEVTK